MKLKVKLSETKSETKLETEAKQYFDWNNAKLKLKLSQGFFFVISGPLRSGGGGT